MVSMQISETRSHKTAVHGPGSGPGLVNGESHGTDSSTLKVGLPYSSDQSWFKDSLFEHITPTSILMPIAAFISTREKSSRYLGEVYKKK